MTSFVSEKVAIKRSPQEIFHFLSDFNNFGKLMPDKVTNWISTKEHCSFTIQGMADLALKIGQKTEFSAITYISDGNKPFVFDLNTQISDIDQSGSNVQIVLNADLSPLLQMMAGRPLQNFVNLLVNKLKETIE